MSRKIMFSFLLMLLIAIGLIGCSSAQEADSGSEGAGEEASSTGGVLVFGRGGDSVTLDPAMSTDGESLKVTTNIYDTLVNYGEQDTTIHEGLATKWDVSEDGLVYTFTLREGVTFHDGTDFNADAVVFNFERWMNPDNQGDFASFAAMFGGYAGDENAVINEVKAKDEYTVEFTLNSPQAPFLNNLAMAKFAIASPTAIEQYGDKFNENPVGTGPFVFKEWQRNDRIVLEKNEDYYVEGLPKLDRVIFRAIPDNSARMNALLTGEIDLMDGLNPSDVAQFDGRDEFQVIFRPSMNIGYLGFNTTVEELSNPLVRKALSYAIDREGIIDAFFEGQAEPAKNPIPPSVAGYNDDIEPYTYDLEKAKELLKEAGYEEGFEIDLWAMPVPRPYMPDGRKVAEAMQSSFAEIGVTANIVSYEWATYLEKLRNGEGAMFLAGWTGDNGDPDNFLYTLLDYTNIGGNNYAQYTSEALHEVLVDARTNPNPEEREELYKQAQEIIYADAPWAPLVHSTPALAAKSNVSGFLPHPTLGSDKLVEVELK